MAKVLCVSTRTLYNRLEEAGTTYREVLDDTRRLLAEDYLLKGLPVNEIAYLTGFSDTANFSRAFKKWTGHSPIGFRELASSRGRASRHIAHTNLAGIDMTDSSVIFML